MCSQDVLIRSLFDVSTEYRKTRFYYVFLIWFRGYGKHENDIKNFVKGLKKTFLNKPLTLYILQEKLYCIENDFFFPLKLLFKAELLHLIDLIKNEILTVVPTSNDYIEFEMVDSTINYNPDRFKIYDIIKEFITREVNKFTNNDILKKVILESLNL